MNMQFSALQIATLLKGKLEGDPDVMIDDIAKIEKATASSLCFIANPKYEGYLYTTDAAVIIVDKDLRLNKPVKATLIMVEDAYSSFALLLEKYNQILEEKRVSRSGVQQPAFIADSATLGENVYVGAFAYVGENVLIGENTKIYPGAYLGDNAKIGRNTTIFPGVKIYFDCEVGDNVIIHAGTVIGGDGFGFAPKGEGDYQKVPQIGNVKIEDEVEIGANTTIDRATIGSTVIGKGVKLDNRVQIAHNVESDRQTDVA